MSRVGKGFYITIPECYLKKSKNNETAAVKFRNKMEHFKIVSKTVIEATKHHHSHVVVTILVEQGCHLCGDMMHAGSANLTIHGEKVVASFNDLLKIFETVQDGTILLNMMQEFDELVCFFCKTSHMI
jgi:hypothetical protein